LTTVTSFNGSHKWIGTFSNKRNKIDVLKKEYKYYYLHDGMLLVQEAPHHG
jgi:hypothetical protein